MFRVIRTYLLEGDLQAALQKHADAIGDREKHKALFNHFRLKAEAIDPKKDHWSYAEMRDKELEHQASSKEKDKEVDQWIDRIEEIETKLTRLPQRPSKRPLFLFLKRKVATV